MNKPRSPLRAFRFEHNLKQSDLAKEMNLSTTAISKLENDSSSHPTVRRVLKYCRNNNLPPELFFPYD